MSRAGIATSSGGLVRQDVQLPVVASYRAARRKLEVARPEQGEAKLATDGVLRRFVDRRVGMGETAVLSEEAIAINSSVADPRERRASVMLASSSMNVGS
jgi:hypothetical protein